MEYNDLKYAMESNKAVHYMNNQKVDEIPFLAEVMHKALEELRHRRKYIVFGCLHCGTLGTSLQPLERCKGCDLVDFCSADCRKKQWKYHKELCKQFPVTNGRNVHFYNEEFDCKTKGPNSPKQCTLLNKRLLRAQEKDTYLRYLFIWRRICLVCKGAIPENVPDCECSCVSYCSTECKKMNRGRPDKGHQKMCKSMKTIAQISSFYRNYDSKNIPSITFGTVKNIYKPMKSLDVDHIHLSIKKKLGKDNKWVDAMTGIMSERLAYPMAIFFVLQELSDIRLKTEGLPFYKATNLTIHISHRHPVLDSSVWEYFLHCLPKLKQLNIVFVSPDMFVTEQNLQAFQPLDFCSNVDLKLERCHNCVARNRIITYSVISMHYHMYFSSENYIEPDIVAIYDVKHEMMDNLDEDSDSNCFDSINSMTYDRETLLVLVDSSKNNLKDTVDDLVLASHHQLDVILDPKPNKLAGFNSTRQFNNTPETVHVACLKKEVEIIDGISLFSLLNPDLADMDLDPMTLEYMYYSDNW